MVCSFDQKLEPQVELGQVAEGMPSLETSGELCNRGCQSCDSATPKRDYSPIFKDLRDVRAAPKPLANLILSEQRRKDAATSVIEGFPIRVGCCLDI